MPATKFIDAAGQSEPVTQNPIPDIPIYRGEVTAVIYVANYRGSVVSRESAKSGNNQVAHTSAQIDLATASFAVVPTHNGLLDDCSALENIERSLTGLAFDTREFRTKDAEDRLEEVGLLPGVRHVAPRSLNVEAAKRLAIARALCQPVEIVVVRALSETVNSESVRLIILMLRETATRRDIGVVVEVGGLVDADVADTVVILSETEVVLNGKPAELRASENPTVQQLLDSVPPHGRIDMSEFVLAG